MHTPDRLRAPDTGSRLSGDSCPNEHTVDHHRRVSVGVDGDGIRRDEVRGEPGTTTEFSGARDAANADATGSWADVIVQYEVERGTKLQECAAVDGYGPHRWTTVSVAFTTPVAMVGTGTLSVVLGELFAPTGVTGQVVVPVVAALATLGVCNVTVGCVDVDLPFDTPAVLPTVSRRYGECIGDTTGLVPIPGVHNG